MMKVYLSGRMSGLSEEEIRESFTAAEVTMIGRGYKVSNPARWRWFLKYLPYRFALAFDLLMMCFCDGIYLLDGWTLSDGAAVEHKFACATGMIILYKR